MTPRNYDIETSKLILVEGDDGNNSYKDVWVIFDVSPTVNNRYIAIHWQKEHPNEKNWPIEILTVFDYAEEVLRWCAYRKSQGAEFRTGLDQQKYQDVEWLDELCNSFGYDNFEYYFETEKDLWRNYDK